MQGASVPPCDPKDPRTSSVTTPHSQEAHRHKDVSASDTLRSAISVTFVADTQGRKVGAYLIRIVIHS